MIRTRFFAIAACAFVVLFAGAVPALAANGPGQDTVVAARDGAVLTVHFAAPLSPAAAAAAARLSRDLAVPAAHGPKGAFLYCNHLYRFSDSDGSYTFQHKCGGTTGPWGYQLSKGLCSIVVSDVHEHGMAWHRNGHRQGTQAQHTKFCRYQFHGNYNPDHDYDFISYSDTFTFKVDVGGEVGNADLVISGSFTSAGCQNRIACGP